MLGVAAGCARQSWRGSAGISAPDLEIDGSRAESERWRGVASRGMVASRGNLRTIPGLV